MSHREEREFFYGMHWLGIMILLSVYALQFVTEWLPCSSQWVVFMVVRSVWATDLSTESHTLEFFRSNSCSGYLRPRVLFPLGDFSASFLRAHGSIPFKSLVEKGLALTFLLRMWEHDLTTQTNSASWKTKILIKREKGCRMTHLHARGDISGVLLASDFVIPWWSCSAPIVYLF